MTPSMEGSSSCGGQPKQLDDQSKNSNTSGTSGSTDPSQTPPAPDAASSSEIKTNNDEEGDVTTPAASQEAQKVPGSSSDERTGEEALLQDAKVAIGVLADDSSSKQEQPAVGAYLAGPGDDGMQRLRSVSFGVISPHPPPVEDEEHGATSSHPGQYRLSQATAVEDEPVRMVAEPCGGDIDAPHHDKRQSRKFERRCASIALATLIALAAVAALVSVLPDWGSSSSASAGEGDEPNSPTKISLESHVLSLLPEYTVDAIFDDYTEDSPQASSFKWIMGDPNLAAYSDERIVQRFSLATLYYSTSGDDWVKNENWMSYDVHECMWHNQDVLKIAKALNVLDSFSEEIVNVSFAVLRKATSYPCEDPVTEQKYQHLWLLANNLQGQLPPELYLLTSLKSINLAMNRFTDTALSTEIGRLSSLEGLYMQNTNTGGTLPTEVGLLTRLHSLFITHNNLVGTIPSEFGLLSDHLRALELSLQTLSGTIPTSLASLTDIDFFDISQNMLTGTIPTELGEMTGAKAMFCIGTNSLVGTIPTQLGRLQNLTALFLHENTLTGHIPSDLGLLTGVERFGLFNNQLNGTLPTELGALKKSKWLVVGANKLGGTIPSELGMLHNAHQLYLDTNELTGSVPVEIADLVTNGKLEEFHIHINNLAGALHDDLCLIDTVSDYNSNLTGCTCACQFDFSYLPDMTFCTPLPDPPRHPDRTTTKCHLKGV